jgi:hypothetical protein
MTESIHAEITDLATWLKMNLDQPYAN